MFDRTDPAYSAYIRILEAELIPATGCTEPIAIAYGAAKVRQALGALPERCRVECSGNIIKNVKSVVVPNTGYLRGIEAAAAAGLVAGDPDVQLQVISHVAEKDREAIRAYRDSHPIEVVPYPGDKVFYIAVTVWAGTDSARVVIEDFHTNITRIEKNGACLFALEGDCPDQDEGEEAPEYDLLSVERIIDFADHVDLFDVEVVLDRQIAYNTAISQEGLTHGWGARIGQTLLEAQGNGVRVRAKAAAAAGSDARMSGGEMPVVIVSGSGNQGMTASLPVIEYAKELNVGREKLLRALVVSNLVTIHQKTSIGRLSAFCGAVSAGCGAAAGIAYLHGDGYEVIAHTIVNTLAILSGMVCDGAKPSCAGKIAMAVEAGLMGYEMYTHGKNQFYSGEGIVKKGVDNTIRTVGRMAREGMRDTDREILDIMTESC